MIEYYKTETPVKNSWVVKQFRKSEIKRYTDRCKYCNSEILNRFNGFANTDMANKCKGYCSFWCWEIDNPPEIKGRVCKVKECDNLTQPFLRLNRGSGNIVSTGVYNTFCEECKVVKGRRKVAKYY